MILTLTPYPIFEPDFVSECYINLSRTYSPIPQYLEAAEAVLVIFENYKIDIQDQTLCY
jgi:hypothetical protein